MCTFTETYLKNVNNINKNMFNPLAIKTRYGDSACSVLDMLPKETKNGLSNLAPRPIFQTVSEVMHLSRNCDDICYNQEYYMYECSSKSGSNITSYRIGHLL